jgi:hypothetical protein
MLYPTDNLEFDGEHSPRKDISSMKVLGLNKETDNDVVLTNASYINDDNLKKITHTGREVRTGIKFWKETEKGVLVIDFTSLRNFNELDFKLTKIVYSRKNKIDFFEWPNKDTSQNSLYIIEEPITDGIQVISQQLKNGNARGIFRVEVNTDIKEIDHVKVYFSCELLNNEMNEATFDMQT